MFGTKKQRLLSGVKPTGRPHIGNYFGAMKQFVDLQNSGNYESFIFVADYHALNFIQDGAEMRELIVDLVKDYMAIGLDPAKTLIYQQSSIPEHAELAWIFDTITTMPYLMRAHAYKDAEAKNKEISVGTFNYPMLMAADILLYDPDVVPVGQDQKQHVEYARDTAEKFNRIFGETFKLPKEIILESVAVVPGTDGKKMSKSYGNTIPLFGSREEIAKAVMSIVTDSVKIDTDSIHEGKVTKIDSIHIPKNIYAIHKLLKSEEELTSLYTEKKGNYKALKEALIEDLDAFVAPMREKRASLSRAVILGILEEGAERARERASKKMAEVRKKVGVAL